MNRPSTLVPRVLCALIVAATVLTGSAWADEPQTIYVNNKYEDDPDTDDDNSDGSFRKPFTTIQDAIDALPADGKMHCIKVQSRWTSGNSGFENPPYDEAICIDGKNVEIKNYRRQVKNGRETEHDTSTKAEIKPEPAEPGEDGKPAVKATGGAHVKLKGVSIRGQKGGRGQPDVDDGNGRPGGPGIKAEGEGTTVDKEKTTVKGGSGGRGHSGGDKGGKGGEGEQADGAHIRNLFDAPAEGGDGGDGGDADDDDDDGGDGGDGGDGADARNGGGIEKTPSSGTSGGNGGTGGAGGANGDDGANGLNGASERADDNSFVIEVPEGDIDGDGVPNDEDNCPYFFNPGQEDSDDDGICDASDPCPFIGIASNDQDGDGIVDEADTCPCIADGEQGDADFDGVGDFCDPIDLRINELRIDQPGNDSDEYVELAGLPGTALDGVWYVVVGDNDFFGGSGVVEEAIDLTGQVIGPEGYFVIAEPSFGLGPAHMIHPLNFENDDNVTHLLVMNFVGGVGMDLDPDDDGTLDETLWDQRLDSVALIESLAADGAELAWFYAVWLGPIDGNVPSQISRCENDGTWTIGAFEIDGTETPGLPNFECAGPCPADLDGDGDVDVSDLLGLLGEWGPCPGCASDLNGDGTVDVGDVLIMLGAWGGC